MHDPRLIHLYYEVWDFYITKLIHSVQRFSPNGNQGYITDEELITIYLYLPTSMKANLHMNKFMNTPKTIG